MVIWDRLLCKVAGDLVRMDDHDQRLLAELRRDGRASLSDLAGRLGVSRATVRARMERMTASGEIVGYTVLTRSDVTAAPVRGLMMIRVEGRNSTKVLARLTGIAAVQAVHSTNGTWSAIAELAAQSLLELDDVINRIRDIEGVMHSETNLLLSTRKTGRR
jgi:DNA-binding Lrp family transcriptional regulator